MYKLTGEALVKIVLAGNPNSGKTSLFNILTGTHQHVGNWGGVTVEVKEGMCRYGDRQFTLIDLPGTYSLSAYSAEERVARDVIVQTQPDAVINVVDASNLERNLYLTIQLLELEIRPVLALNMWDEVTSKGVGIDIARLSQILDVPIITTVARTGEGKQQLLESVVNLVESGRSHYDRPAWRMPVELTAAIDALSQVHTLVDNGKYPGRWLATKLLENDELAKNFVQPLTDSKTLFEKVDSARLAIHKRLGDDPDIVIAETRYAVIAGALRETLTPAPTDRAALSDSIDNVLTHPVMAYPVFMMFMFLLFQATFTLGAYPMAWIESLFGLMAQAVQNILGDTILSEAISNGVIGGVGSVIVFLPNILILFLGISIMEDTGYMSRAAFIMDKFMHRIGLHGKSFIPILIGMGCTVPAIMAARTLESEKDRIKTILLTPLISCSARLPVFVLFAGALFPHKAGVVVFLFQFVFGLVAFFGMGYIFKKTILKGDDHPFVMELPPYRLPTFRSVVIHMWQKAQHYLKKMGGVVLLFSVLLWALSTFPRDRAAAEKHKVLLAEIHNSSVISEQVKTDSIQILENRYAAQVIKRTFVGQFGKFLEPVVRPLGLDWHSAVAFATGFVAKEIVVSSLGVLYAAGEADETNQTLRTRISQNFTPLTGLAFMAFVLLYTPCIVALSMIVRELKNWRWSVFSVVYQLVLAWAIAFGVYQGGRLLGLS